MSAASNEKVCEQCHKVFQTEAEVCPEDGGKLLEVAGAEALVGTTLDGKLTLTGVLGRGGMGVVYRARQHSIDREVAVKVLHPSYSSDTDAVRRFLHEARAATRLEHPNVITVFDFGRSEGGLLYIVMELLSGHSLGSEINGGPMAPARAVHLLTQIADAVHHAHERGLVHRDLKPENVYLAAGSLLRGDTVKVLDFGIATMVARAYEGIERITRTGAVCGTPAYMSPEQVLGDEVDPRSDVYALGLIAYEMLTGAHPLPADTPMRQMLAHLEKPVPTFAMQAPGLEIPPGLEVAVRHALEKSRETRTQTALEFANELVRGLSGADVSAPVLGVPIATTSPQRPAALAAAASSMARQVDGKKTGPQGDKRGFADTARATPAPDLRAINRKKWLPWAALAAIALIVALVLAWPAATPGPRPEVVVEATHAPETKVVGTKPVPEPETKTPAVPVVEKKPEPVVEKKPVEPAVEKKPEPVVKITSVILATKPIGASVMVGDKQLGTTPMRVELPKDATKLSLTLKKKGYKSKTVELDATTTTDLELELEKTSTRPTSDAPGIVEDGD